MKRVRAMGSGRRRVAGLGLIAGLAAAGSGCGSDDNTGEAVIGVWSIVDFGEGGELANPIESTEPTLAFSDEGILQVFTGCNTGLASWEVDGSSLTVGPLAQTAMSCPEPPGVMEQEATISVLIEGATSAEVDGDTLRLTSDGVVVIEAEAQ